MSEEMVFDTSDFDKKFEEITKKAIPELLEKGLGKAMLILLGDCIMETPTVPIKEGWLRGSGSIFVQNRLVAVSEAGKPKYASQDHSEAIAISSLVGVIGFNAPYAAKMHEGVSLHFTDPASGAKYLESKLLRNRERYMREVASTVSEKK